MAEADNSNGVYVEAEAIGVGVGVGDGDGDDSDFSKPKHSEITLRDILNRIAGAVLFPDPDTPGPVLHRLKLSLSENIPLLREASQNTARNIYTWTRQGTPFRALFVASVGTIALLALTGLLIFMVFFVLATINAIVLSLLMSLAAAGGFLAIFFTCLMGIYIGALSLAVFVISTTTISAIIAASIATGWIGFFFTVWLATTKSFSLAKRTMNMTGSALSAYSSARHASNGNEPNK